MGVTKAALATMPLREVEEARIVMAAMNQAHEAMQKDAKGGRK